MLTAAAAAAAAGYTLCAVEGMFAETAAAPAVECELAQLQSHLVGLERGAEIFQDFLLIFPSVRFPRHSACSSLHVFQSLPVFQTIPRRRTHAIPVSQEFASPPHLVVKSSLSQPPETFPRRGAVYMPVYLSVGWSACHFTHLVVVVVRGGI